LLLGGVALGLAASAADAAESRHRFNIPTKPLSDALIDLGVQANVSILGTSACGDQPVSLKGAYTLEAALRRMVPPAACRYQIMDARTVRISAPQPRREPPPQSTLISEVLVTATKRPASLDRLPAGVSSISRSQIELSGAADVGDTTGQLAGVLTTNLGPGRDKLLIRGLSDGAFTGRARSTVSTYLDNAPINFNAPDPDLRLVDIERVEVIRGPQGALYGSGSLSGIYRIVTRKPDLISPAAGLAASASNTKSGAASYEVEGYGNVVITPDRLGLRFVAYHEVQGGYLDNASLRLSNVDKTVRSGGRLALRARLSDSWRLDLSATNQRLQSSDTQYSTPIAGPLQRINRVRESHSNDFSQAGLTLHGELDWADISSTLAYIDHTYASRYDASRYDASVQLLGLFGASPMDLGIYSEQAGVRMMVQDLVLTSPSPGRFGWLVGAYGGYALERSPSDLSIATTAGQLVKVYRETRRDNFREIALYGEATYEFAPGWTAAFGARLFGNRIRTTADIVGQFPTVPRFFISQRQFNGLSPKLSVQYEFKSGDLVYGLFSEGYRSGGFNSGGVIPLSVSRSAFSSDRLRNYEIGAKVRLLDRRLLIRTAGYYADWTNIQTDQYRPSGLAYTANVGDARIFGWETELSYEWDFGLSIQLNGLFSGSELTRANPDFAAQLVGELPGVPRSSGGLLLTYQRPVFDRTLRLIADISYVGRSALSFDAGLTPRMGHYLRARLGVEIAGDTWSLAAFVSNPANDAGDTFAYGNPFSFGRVRQVTPQRPRTFGLRLAADF
jgi:iron complex outermembrane recepter protein